MFLVCAALGLAAMFGVIGSSTVTSSGLSVINGSLALYPGSDVVGFPPGEVTGNIYIDDAVATKAQDDAGDAYAYFVSLPHNASADLSGSDLVGLTLTAGKYFFAKSAQLSGNLTLDGQGDHSAIFIIQTGTTFQTSVSSNINLINGAKSCNVFIVVGSSATIGSSSAIRGSILAYTNVVLHHNVWAHGTMVALGAAVNMDANTIVAPADCIRRTSPPSSK
uniref:Ice-binding protein 5 n=1 Tax=Chloromonas brevispina TaxID=201318 RepID=A0A060L0I8_9CHLO|nr:ice-binding protein 5 [Chloromonas brevispina]